jgi:prepilin peptidase CpaA
MALVCVAVLAALLLVGAAIDIRSRRLPNWLTAGVVGLYALYAIASPVPVDWASALAVAATSLVLGFMLFAFHLMGGGDVKLIAGLALWAGLDLIALFLLVTGLAGGLLSVGMLLVRRIASHPVVATVVPFLSMALANRWGLALPDRLLAGGWNHAEADQAAESIPYGVAIAAGGFAVIYALLKL